jgi:hypothetical protein
MKTEKIEIRVEKFEKQYIKAMAKKKNWSISKFIMQRLYNDRQFRLLNILAEEYPNLDYVEHEANCDTSVKFTRYGANDMDICSAIYDTKDLIIEIYNSDGELINKIDLWD